MPHQQLVFDVGGELVRDPETGFWVPAYPEVVVTIPRQNGKTTIVLVWEVDRLWLWEAFDGKPQFVVYTAQTGTDARRKFRKDQVPILQRSSFGRGISKVRLAAEDMGLTLANGADLSVWNNSPEAGHGSTVDLGTLDEIFADDDDDREQALIPAMATRHDRQKLITSTAGTDRSLVLTRKQRLGQAAVMEGRTDGLAYFEWSADPDADPEDPATWRSCMPALGHTITERTVSQALDEMRTEDGNLDEFKRAWLNIPKRSGGGREVSAVAWQSVQDDVEPDGRLVFGVDATPDHGWASIAVGDGKGRGELVDHDTGVGWVVDRATDLAKRHNGSAVLDVNGPAGHLASQLEDKGVQVHKLSPGEYRHACGWMYDAIADRTITVRPHPVLDAAVEQLAKRPVGDSWVWSRRTRNADISSFVALNLALATSTTQTGTQAWAFRR